MNKHYVQKVQKFTEFLEMGIPEIWAVLGPMVPAKEESVSVAASMYSTVGDKIKFPLRLKKSF